MKYGIRQKSLPLPDEKLFIEAQHLGFDGVELNTEPDYSTDRLWRHGEAERLKKFARATGIEVHTISLSAIRDYGFLNTDSEKRKVGQQLIKHLSEAGSQMGATVIMLPIISTTHKDVASPLLVDGLQEAAKTAEDNGIYLALEVFLSADDVLDIIQRVNSEYVKVCFDVGITTVCGYDVYVEMVKLKKMMVQIHMKDSVRPKELGEGHIEFPDLKMVRDQIGWEKWGKQLGEGSVNFASVRKAIRHINYDGYLILETPPDDDPLGNAARNLKFVQELI